MAERNIPRVFFSLVRGVPRWNRWNTVQPLDCTTHCFCQLPIIYLRVRFRAPWMIPTTQTSFRTRSVKGLRRGFDSPNGGEHSTLSPICTRDLHNAVTSSPPLPPLLRSAHTLCDPQRTFNPEKNEKTESDFGRFLHRSRIHRHRSCPVSQKTCPKCPFDWIPFAET